MALTNIKRHVQAVRQNVGILDTDQIQLETTSTPTDSDLGVGRMHCDGSTIYGHNGTTWVDMMATASINIAAWETLYAADTNLAMAGASLTFAGTHATNDTLTLSASGTGDCIAFANTGSGYDISGTDDEWSIKSSSNLGVLELGTGGTINATGGNLELSVGSSTTTIQGDILVDETSIFTGAVTATASVTITGSADTDVLVITDGDALMSNGLLQIVSDDTATGSITITSAATTGNVITILADDLAGSGASTGWGIMVDSNNGASFGDGGFFNCEDSGTSRFKIVRYGATTIAGSNGVTVLTLTAGDLLVTQGSITVTNDDDNAATLSITNDTATTADVIVFAGSGTFTGDSFMSVAPSGLTTGSALAITCAALTQGEALLIDTNAITSGNAVKISNTGEALTSGELLTISNAEDGDLATKTGNLVSITSVLDETGATDTQDYDTLLVSRTDIADKSAATYTAQGSGVKILHTSTQTQATLTDSVIGLEVELSGATALGHAAQITNVGVTGSALNVVSANVGADDVLITLSGAHTNGYAGLHVTSSGNLATGGANLILTVSGAACDAAARAFEIDAQKDVQAVYIDTDGITNDAVYITHSGNLAAGKAVMHITDAGTPAADNVYVLHAAMTGTATAESVVIFADGGGKDVTGILVDCDARYSAANLSAHLTLYGDEAGDYPILMQFYHSDAGAASGEYCAKVNFFGTDDHATPAKELYASIEVEMDDVTNATPDGILWIKGDLAGTNTVSAGFTGNKILMGAAASTITTAGAWELTLSTNDGTDSSTIVIDDAANGDISLAINGTGNLNVQNLTYQTNAGSVVATTATLTWGDAEGQVVYCTSVGGAYTITLPAAATVGAGGWYLFIKTDADANAITLDANASETIGPAGGAMAATYAGIDAIHDSVLIVCDGTSWYITGGKVS